MQIKIGFLILILSLALVGCSTNPKKIQQQEPEELYTKAYKLLQKKEYTEAAELFDEVDKQHPYSIWAPKAQIMAAYSFYLKNDYEDALLALDRFIQLHPGNRDAPYAYYLKGLCYFEQMSNIEREQNKSEDALLAFNTLVARYPNSIYTKDALAKIQIILGQLAGKEMEVGRYYQRYGDYVPALTRFQNVVVGYPQTKQLPEALYRMGVCFYALGIQGQAQFMLKELKQQFPKSDWTQKLEKVLKP